MGSSAVGQCCALLVTVCRIGAHKCCQKLCCRRDSPPRPQYSVVCLGLSGAGKTTLLALLCGEKAEDVIPTIGFSIKAVPLPDAVLNAKELGGGAEIQPHWHRYYDGTEGIVFVFDSACSDDELKEVSAVLSSTLAHPSLRCLPLLLLASHQDKPTAQSREQLMEALNLTELKQNHETVLHLCSCDDVAGTREGFTRLAQILHTSTSEEDKDNRV